MFIGIHQSGGNPYPCDTGIGAQQSAEAVLLSLA